MGRAGHAAPGDAPHQRDPDYIELLLAAGGDVEEPQDTDDALAVLRGTTVSGTGSFSYSNSNYVLLGEVVAAASGQDLPSFVAAEIFAPAGMVAVMDPLAEPPGRARSYRRDGDGWRALDSRWSQVGDGGVQTTTTELAEWGRQYWAPSVGGEQLATAREAGAVLDGEPGGSRYGAGVRFSQVPGVGRVASHLGAWEGFVTAFAVATEHELSVVATCAAAELEPVRPDVALDVLRAWVPSLTSAPPSP